jgi:hypothetical protein
MSFKIGDKLIDVREPNIFTLLDRPDPKSFTLKSDIDGQVIVLSDSIITACIAAGTCFYWEKPK